MTLKELSGKSVIVSIWVLLVIAGLSRINFNSDILNPMSKAFADFELTDIYFSHIKESPKVDTNIVMVNIGNLDRAQLAAMIEIINQHKPKIIAIDAFFRNPKHSPDVQEDMYFIASDTMLSRAFAKVENLILVSELIEDTAQTDSVVIQRIAESHPMFMQYATPAFADVITKGHDYIKYARHCVPKQVFNDSVVLSFPTQIAMVYDSAKANRYLKRGNDVEVVNFQGNIDTRKEGRSVNSKPVFFALDVEDVFNGFDPSIIKDKIIIMGYMGKSFGDHTWEDKFCTPLNDEYIGRALPDMYGVVVHANVVSMILKEDYINDMPEWINILLSLIFIYLNMWLFSWLHLNTAEWWDGLSMIFSLVGVLLLSTFMVYIFAKYNLEVDITLASVALLLSGNLVEIYWALINPLYFRIKEKFVPLPNDPIKLEENEKDLI
ncbi:MAG: CHASE2 domain-containing protein [Cytophagaceae bacterium]